MTKKAIISTAELKRMAQVANSEGVTVELERDGTIMRVMPFRPPKMIVPKLSREEEAEAALAKWLASRQKLSGDLRSDGSNASREPKGEKGARKRPARSMRPESSASGEMSEADRIREKLFLEGLSKRTTRKPSR